MELVRKSYQEFYSVYELIRVKELLYAVDDKTVLPKFIIRRDRSITSETDAVVNDMISGINKLDEPDQLFALLSPIDPQCISAETNALGTRDKILNLEIQNNLSENIGRTIDWGASEELYVLRVGAKHNLDDLTSVMPNVLGVTYTW